MDTIKKTLIQAGIIIAILGGVAWYVTGLIDKLAGYSGKIEVLEEQIDAVNQERQALEARAEDAENKLSKIMRKLKRLESQDAKIKKANNFDSAVDDFFNK